MKKVMINEKCVGCGACFDMTELIVENDEGFAAVGEQSYLDAEKMEELQEVIAACPNQAIEIIDGGLVEGSGPEGLNKLYQLITNEIKEFKVDRPEPKGYHFKKEDYKYPITQSAKSFRYDYKSDNRAESAGLREFDRVMYSQRRAIIQGILVEYKIKHLKEFYEPEKKEGHYYFEQNRRVQDLLQSYANEALSLTDGKLGLPEAFTKFYVEPDLGYEGFGNIGRLKDLEEVNYTSSIINELEPLQWFDSWIDTDYQENSRGKDVYCFKSMTEASVKFGDQILNECGYVLNGVQDIDRDVNLVADTFVKALNELVRSKLQNVLDELEAYMKQAGIEIEEIVETMEEEPEEEFGGGFFNSAKIIGLSGMFK